MGDVFDSIVMAFLQQMELVDDLSPSSLAKSAVPIGKFKVNNQHLHSALGHIYQGSVSSMRKSVVSLASCALCYDLIIHQLIRVKNEYIQLCVRSNRVVNPQKEKSLSLLIEKTTSSRESVLKQVWRHGIRPSEYQNGKEFFLKNTTLLNLDQKVSSEDTESALHTTIGYDSLDEIIQPLEESNSDIRSNEPFTKAEENSAVNVSVVPSTDDVQQFVDLNATINSSVSSSVVGKSRDTTLNSTISTFKAVDVKQLDKTLSHYLRISNLTAIPSLLPNVSPGSDSIRQSDEYSVLEIQYRSSLESFLSSNEATNKYKFTAKEVYSPFIDAVTTFGTSILLRSKQELRIAAVRVMEELQLQNQQLQDRIEKEWSETHAGSSTFWHSRVNVLESELRNERFRVAELEEKLIRLRAVPVSSSNYFNSTDVKVAEAVPETMTPLPVVQIEQANSPEDKSSKQDSQFHMIDGLIADVHYWTNKWESAADELVVLRDECNSLRAELKRLNAESKVILTSFSTVERPRATSMDSLDCEAVILEPPTSSPHSEHDSVVSDADSLAESHRSAAPAELPEYTSHSLDEVDGESYMVSGWSSEERILEPLSFSSLNSSFHTQEEMRERILLTSPSEQISPAAAAVTTCTRCKSMDRLAETVTRLEAELQDAHRALDTTQQALLLKENELARLMDTLDVSVLNVSTRSHSQVNTHASSHSSGDQLGIIDSSTVCPSLLVENSALSPPALVIGLSLESLKAALHDSQLRVSALEAELATLRAPASANELTQADILSSSTVDVSTSTVDSSRMTAKLTLPKVDVSTSTPPLVSPTVDAFTSTTPVVTLKVDAFTSTPPLVSPTIDAPICSPPVRTPTADASTSTSLPVPTFTADASTSTSPAFTADVSTSTAVTSEAVPASSAAVEPPIESSPISTLSEGFVEKSAPDTASTTGSVTREFELETAVIALPSLEVRLADSEKLRTQIVLDNDEVLKGYKERLSQLESELQSLREVASQASVLSEKWEADLLSGRQREETLSLKVSELEAREKALSSSVSALQSNLLELEVAKRSGEERMQSMMEELEQQFLSLQKERDALQISEAALDATVNALQSKLRFLESNTASITQLSALEADNSSLKSTVEALGSDLHIAIAAKYALEARLSSAEAEKTSLTSKLEAEEAARKDAALQLETLKSELAAAQATLASLRTVEAELAVNTATLNKREQELEDAESRIKSHELRCQSLEDQVRGLSSLFIQSGSANVPGAREGAVTKAAPATSITEGSVEILSVRSLRDMKESLNHSSVLENGGQAALRGQHLVQEGTERVSRLQQALERHMRLQSKEGSEEQNKNEVLPENTNSSSGDADDIENLALGQSDSVDLTVPQSDTFGDGSECVSSRNETSASISPTQDHVSVPSVVKSNSVDPHPSPAIIHLENPDIYRSPNTTMSIELDYEPARLDRSLDCTSPLDCSVHSVPSERERPQAPDPHEVDLGLAYVRARIASDREALSVSEQLIAVLETRLDSSCLQLRLAERARADAEAARELEATLRARLEASLQAVGSELKDSDALRQSLSSYQSTVAEYQAEIGSLRSQLEETQLKWQDSLAKLVEVTLKLDESKLKFDETNSALDEAKSQLKDITNLLEESRSQLAMTHSQLDETTSQLNESNSQVGATKTQLEEKQATLDNITSQLSETKSELDAVKAELSNSRSALALSESSVTSLEEEVLSVRNALVTASLQLKEQSALLKESEARSLATASELRSLEGFLKSVEVELTLSKQELAETKEELSSTKNEHTSANQALQSAQEELCSTKQACSALDAELTLMKRNFSEIEEELTSTKELLSASHKELDSSREQFASLQESYEKRKSELEESLQVKSDKLVALRMEGQESEKRCTALQQSVLELKASLESKEASVSVLQASLDQERDAAAKSEAEASRQTAELHELRLALSRTKQLLQELLEASEQGRQIDADSRLLAGTAASVAELISAHAVLLSDVAPVAATSTMNCGSNGTPVTADCDFAEKANDILQSLGESPDPNSNSNSKSNIPPNVESNADPLGANLNSRERRRLRRLNSRRPASTVSEINESTISTTQSESLDGSIDLDLTLSSVELEATPQDAAAPGAVTDRAVDVIERIMGSEDSARTRLRAERAEQDLLRARAAMHELQEAHAVALRELEETHAAALAEAVSLERSRNDLLQGECKEQEESLVFLSEELQAREEQLSAVQKELQSVSLDMENTKHDFDAAISELDLARTELDSSRNLLDATKNELNNARNELSSTQNTLNSMKHDLESSQAELMSVKQVLESERSVHNLDAQLFRERQQRQQAALEQARAELDAAMRARNEAERAYKALLKAHAALRVDSERAGDASQRAVVEALEAEGRAWELAVNGAVDFVTQAISRTGSVSSTTNSSSKTVDQLLGTLRRLAQSESEGSSEETASSSALQRLLAGMALRVASAASAAAAAAAEKEARQVKEADEGMLHDLSESLRRAQQQLQEQEEHFKQQQWARQQEQQELLKQLQSIKQQLQQKEALVQEREQLLNKLRMELDATTSRSQSLQKELDRLSQELAARSIDTSATAAGEASGRMTREGLEALHRSTTLRLQQVESDLRRRELAWTNERAALQAQQYKLLQQLNESSTEQTNSAVSVSAELRQLQRLSLSTHSRSLDTSTVSSVGNESPSEMKQDTGNELETASTRSRSRRSSSSNYPAYSRRRASFRSSSTGVGPEGVGEGRASETEEFLEQAQSHLHSITHGPSSPSPDILSRLSSPSRVEVVTGSTAPNEAVNVEKLVDFVRERDVLLASAQLEIAVLYDRLEEAVSSISELQARCHELSIVSANHSLNSAVGTETVVPEFVLNASLNSIRTARKRITRGDWMRNLLSPTQIVYAVSAKEPLEPPHLRVFHSSSTAGPKRTNAQNSMSALFSPSADELLRLSLQQGHALVVSLCSRAESELADLQLLSQKAVSSTLDSSTNGRASVAALLGSSLAALSQFSRTETPPKVGTAMSRQVLDEAAHLSAALLKLRFIFETVFSAALQGGLKPNVSISSALSRRNSAVEVSLSAASEAHSTLTRSQRFF